MLEDNAVYPSPIIEFRELEVGATFKYVKEEDDNPDDLFRKVEQYQRVRVHNSLVAHLLLVNAVCLNDGSTREIFEVEKVQPIYDPFEKEEPEEREWPF